MGIGSDLIDQAWADHGMEMAAAEAERKGVSAKKTRVFLAHPANMPPKEIKDLIDPVQDLLAAYYNKPKDRFKIITGRADFKRFFAQSGGWKGWTRSVVHRTDAVTGQYMYQLFVVCGSRCGRATASILKHALNAGIEVLQHSDSGLKNVIGIGTEDDDNWRDGFTVTAVEMWDVDKDGEDLPHRTVPRSQKPTPKAVVEALGWLEGAADQTPHASPWDDEDDT